MLVKCSYLPVIRRKRVRMTRRVKPPTAAVTITNTWPWSDAMSDAEGSGEWRMVGERRRMHRVRKGREEREEEEWPENFRKREVSEIRGGKLRAGKDDKCSGDREE